MGDVLFLPHYAEVLESVVTAAVRRGAIDVECDPSIDRTVVASQISWYAASTGRRLRCRPSGGRLAVSTNR
jgi:hypothetical protein